EAEYRQLRLKLLAAYCWAASKRVPNADFIGIGTCPGWCGQEDITITFFDPNAVTDAEKVELEQLRQDLGLFAHCAEHKTLINEYPTQSARPLDYDTNRRNRRNSRCPCGSGL